MFTTCPCGQIRVPVRTDDCPRCGLDLREAESAPGPPPASGVERTP
jgi:hypothetical protein